MKIKKQEIIKQEYAGNNCKISAGFIKGHPIDDVYFRFEKDGVEPTEVYLRPDEMAAIAWCCNGVLWAKLMKSLRKRSKGWN